ncbi:MAG: hypothetical protein QME96_14625, partial [Myxococcota bacterium]|nr:hypothetical protein [Myxococcota bacterium]
AHLRPLRGRCVAPLQPGKIRGFFLCAGAWLVAAAPGCDCGSECAEVEQCNYVDDTCDGRIDEGFVGADGRYSTVENCGRCGVRCDDVFPTAARTACVERLGAFRCEIIECPVGMRPGGAGACVPDVESLCLPCRLDADCELYSSGALCLPTASGERRCGRSCDPADPGGCPAGFDCSPSGDGRGQCRPRGGLCACTPATEGTAFPCLVETPGGQACAGERLCRDGTLGPCNAVFDEACDGLDNDCDEATDEDFRSVAGDYVHDDHCGACNAPCVPPGPGMVAACLAGPPVECDRRCADGFVDLDRILANGCECERTVGTWPPSRLGVDADCDGVIDDTDDYVFVTPSGSDANPGTLVFPMRTPQAATSRAAPDGKSVLIARGRYAGPVEMAAGVSIFGGYAPDFSDRDTSLYPVVIEAAAAAPGMPLLVCRGISAAAEVAGLSIAAAGAVAPGAGSTAVYLDGCTDAVRLSDLVVYSGRGADGAPGASSSQNLSRWGMTSLRDLDGRLGAAGRDGVVSGSAACSGVTVRGGDAGSRSCPGSGNTLDGGRGGDAVCPNTGCRSGSPCGNAGCTDFTVGGVCDMEAVLRAAVPNPAAGAGSGPGGGAAGERTYDAVTNRNSCSFCDDNPTLPREGGNGGAGASGTSGSGAAGCSDSTGSLDPATGRWSARNGGDGTDGADGGGGGGATCGSGYDVLTGVSGCNDALGGSGGGGGSGGCGAPAASGGFGGGSSIGIAIRLPAGAGAGPVL